MFNQKIKGYLSLISSILINLIGGNLFTFPNLIPYYQSYLYYKYDNNEKISLMQLYFIAPIGIFVDNIFPSFMGIIDMKIGIRVLTIFSVILISLSQIIIYFSVEYYLLIISYFIYGFGVSCTYYQTVKNCWKYFPNKKDLMSGIIFSSFGLGSFVFTSIADQIINPDNIPKDGKYYSKEISYRYLSFIKFFIISTAILGIISIILCFPYKEDNIEDNNNNQNNKETPLIKINKIIPLKKMILSLEFAKCLSIAGCTLIFGLLLTNTYRNFGIEKNLDENGMHTLSKVFTLLNTFSRIIWGIICNKFKFKKPYIIIMINQILCGSLIYFSAEKLYTYFIVVCFGVLSYAGHIILFPNLIHSKFGVENSVILLGISGVFSGISALIGPMLTYFIKDLEDYLITYLVGVAPSIVSLILAIFIKIEKFELNDKEIINKIEENDDNKLVERFTATIVKTDNQE